MREQKFVRQFRTAKIVHLVLLACLELLFSIILIANAGLRARIFSNPALSLLCTFVWLLMLFELLFLIYDFYKLRAFARESHLLNQTAYLDHLTGLPNRYGLDEIFRTYTTPETLEDTGCLLFSIGTQRRKRIRSGHYALQPADHPGFQDHPGQPHFPVQPGTPVLSHSTAFRIYFV